MNLWKSWKGLSVNRIYGNLRRYRTVTGEFGNQPSAVGKSDEENCQKIQLGKFDDDCIDIHPSQTVYVISKIYI